MWAVDMMTEKLNKNLRIDDGTVKNLLIDVARIGILKITIARCRYRLLYIRLFHV